MVKESKNPSQFKPYYRDNSLLLQFILIEFISIHDLYLNENENRLTQHLTEQNNSLFKLKNYTDEYLKNLEGNISDADKNFSISIKECLGILFQVSLPIDKKTTLNIKKQVESISKHLKSIITPYRKNENIALFLLKNRERLNQVFGPDFTVEILNSSTSKDKQLLCKLLSSQYEKRGFNKLVPTIKESVFVKDEP